MPTQSASERRRQYIAKRNAEWERQRRENARRAKRKADRLKKKLAAEKRRAKLAAQRAAKAEAERQHKADLAARVKAEAELREEKKPKKRLQRQYSRKGRIYGSIAAGSSVDTSEAYNLSTTLGLHLVTSHARILEMHDDDVEQSEAKAAAYDAVTAAEEALALLVAALVGIGSANFRPFRERAK